MGNAPRCPRCGSSNTRKSDGRLIKGGLAHIGEFALGYGLGWLGLEDVARENADDLSLTQYLDDEYQCKDCGCVWKPGQRPTYTPQHQPQRRESRPQKKKKPQSNNTQQAGNGSMPSYSRRELVDIIAQCEGLRPGTCNESTLLTIDKNIIKQRLQTMFGIQLSKSQINKVNSYKGLVNVILQHATANQGAIDDSSRQENANDFGTDWNRFFDNLDSYLNGRQILESEYNTICRKAQNQKYDNPNASACYYYMASVLCYLFYDNTDNSIVDREYAVLLGKSSINSAKQLLQDDDEFKTLSLVFELLDLVKSESNPQAIFQKLLEIRRKCPSIESIENTLIKNESLREWFDDAYYDILFTKLAEEALENDLELKAKYAKELTNSSNEFFQIFAHAFLADALYDEGKYGEAKRYAKLGMDIVALSEYDHDDGMSRCWGMCWTIYARSQEKLGDMNDALDMFDKGASLGIPWCKQDLERLKPKIENNHTDNNNVTHAEQEGLVLKGYFEGNPYYGHSIPQGTPFRMKAEGVFTIENIGIVISGHVESGEIRPLDTVYLIDDTHKTKTTINKIEMFKKFVPYAEYGDYCGIVVNGNIDWLHEGVLVSSEFDDTINSFCGTFTKSEQEYLETLKESLEDGELSLRERKMLDRIRISLGISEERAKELEASLKSPKLTEDEQEYLNAYKEATADGEMSEKERRLLEKLRVMYGISEERARDIERMRQA